jgi:phenylacetate-coenzyme A ligase PaaK-like adenylate-forming protein
VECRRRLDAYVRHARQLPYYRTRLAAYDADAAHPLAGVPVMQPDELKALLPPFGREIVIGAADDYQVFQSGGTTGFPKTALFSPEEMDALDLANARGYYATGLLPADRVGNLFAGGSLYMTFIHINNMLQRYGCTSFAFAHLAEPGFFKMVAERFQVNVLAGVSSIILKMLRAVAELGETTLKIEKIYFGGEHLYEADKVLLVERFGTTTILSPGYGTVDTWYIGYQCALTPTGVFHAFDDQCWIEIVDEETGEACAPGDVGLVYATPFPRRLTPVVRYRVGDQARWLSTACPCGRATPLFELLGRGDDMFRIGFDTLDYSQISAALGTLGTIVGPFQMERRRRDSIDELVVRIETEAPQPERPDLSRRIVAAILAARPVLAKNIAQGTAWPVVVELLPPHGLPLNPRTGKLKRVIDLKG